MQHVKQIPQKLLPCKITNLVKFVSEHFRVHREPGGVLSLQPLKLVLHLRNREGWRGVSLSPTFEQSIVFHHLLVKFYSFQPQSPHFYGCFVMIVVCPKRLPRNINLGEIKQLKFLVYQFNLLQIVQCTSERSDSNSGCYAHIYWIPETIL